MRKLSRVLYNECKGNSLYRKALSIAIFVKNKRRNSIITYFTPKKLSKIAGINIRTAEKYTNVLIDMGLAMFIGNNNKHLQVAKLRYVRDYTAPKNMRMGSIDISKIDTSSVKSIEIGLCALAITETQKHKDWINHQIKSKKAENVINKQGYRKFKKADKICLERGLDNYCERGISYNYIAKQLNISLNKVGEIIKYGIKQTMFKRIKKPKQYHYIGAGVKYAIGQWIKDSENKGYSVFMNGCFIVKVYANRFSVS